MEQQQRQQNMEGEILDESVSETTPPPSKQKEIEEKNINDWLPITKSRNAKWWYSAFHNVTAVVGAGVLGFPYAMSQLGWFVHHLSLIKVFFFFL